MMKLFAMTAHAQSHSGTKGKIVRNSEGKVIGYKKSNGTSDVTTFTKKAQAAANKARAGNAGTGGTSKG